MTLTMDCCEIKQLKIFYITILTLSSLVMGKQSKQDKSSHTQMNDYEKNIHLRVQELSKTMGFGR